MCTSNPHALSVRFYALLTKAGVRARAHENITTETRLLLRVHACSYWPWAVATEALSAPLAVSARLLKLVPNTREGKAYGIGFGSGPCRAALFKASRSFTCI